MTATEKKEHILIAAGIYGIISELLPLEMSMLTMLFLLVFISMAIMILFNKTPKIITSLSAKTPIMKIILTNLGVPACMDILFFLGFIILAQVVSPSALESYRVFSEIVVKITYVIAILLIMYKIYKYKGQKK